MITSDAVKDRLAGIDDSPFRFCGLASDFDAALDQLKTSPSLFVLPSKALAGEDGGLTGRTRQQITKKFSVIIGVTRIGAAGGKQLNDIEALEQAVIDRLVGWQPDGATQPFVYGGGEMVGVDVEKGVMFWGSDFATEFYLRKDTST